MYILYHTLSDLSRGFSKVFEKFLLLRHCCVGTYYPLTTLILYHKGRKKSRGFGNFLFVNLYKYLAKKGVKCSTLHKNGRATGAAVPCKRKEVDYSTSLMLIILRTWKYNFQPSNRRKNLRTLFSFQVQNVPSIKPLSIEYSNCLICFIDFIPQLSFEISSTYSSPKGRH